MKMIDNDKRVLDTLRRLQRERGLSDGDKMSISSNEIRTHLYFMKRKVITEQFKPTQDSVIKSLKRLEQKGFIERTGQRREPFLRVNPVVWQKNG